MREDNAFVKQLSGYGLTTAQIFYRLPDHQSVLQEFIWQQYDRFPEFPVLCGFLSFWQRELDGPLHSITVAHQELIKPVDFRSVNGVFRLQQV